MMFIDLSVLIFSKERFADPTWNDRPVLVLHGLLYALIGSPLWGSERAYRAETAESLGAEGQSRPDLVVRQAHQEVLTLTVALILSLSKDEGVREG
jgi:hypothetical protein